MCVLRNTYKRMQWELAPRVTAAACNCGSVFTLLGQMGSPHCDPDKLLGLRVVKMIYYVSMLGTLFWFLLLKLSPIIPLPFSPARRPAL